MAREKKVRCKTYAAAATKAGAYAAGGSKKAGGARMVALATSVKSVMQVWWRGRRARQVEGAMCGIPAIAAGINSGNGGSESGAACYVSKRGTMRVTRQRAATTAAEAAAERRRGGIKRRESRKAEARAGSAASA